ncbi:MAG: class II aldolase/adducin family protein, partial [Candidatus Omnitrophota bacterium]
TYETRLFVGLVPVIEQNSPNVLDITPITEALKTNSLVVLKNHGVITIGDTLLDTLFLTEILEEAVEMQAIAKLFNNSRNEITLQEKEKINLSKKYKLFSKEQIETVVDLVNKNIDIQKQGQVLDLTMRLAIKLDQTQSVFNMHFEKGKISKITNDENADFLISGPDYIWKAIFNRTLDPFVATTQKKLKLKGDFARLSRWYPVFVRIFEIWGQVPVE